MVKSLTLRYFLNPGDIIENIDVNENDNVTVEGMDHIGNMEYYSGRYFDWDVTFEPVEYHSLYRIHNPEGYATNATMSYGPFYFYNRRDHLGNNREVWRASYTWGSTTHAAATVQRTQYYPSGLPWKYNSGDNPGSQPYKYNSKEFVEMHGLDEYDSEARWYYPAIMRTTTMDPHAENYYSISPYAWCANNPVRMVDPDGRDFELTRNDENRSMTVRANYYYSKSNLEVNINFGSVVDNVSYTLESVKSDILISIAESYGLSDYSVIIEFNLIDVDGIIGSNAIDMAKADPIGNSITHDDSPTSASATTRNFKHIRFNAKTAISSDVTFFKVIGSDMKHEYFHTLGLLDRYNKGTETSPKFDAPYIENDLMTSDSPVDRKSGVEPFKRVMNAAGVLLPGTKTVIINRNNKEKP